jgi:flap endonuclease-1
MGTKLKDLVSKNTISIDDLKNKTLIIDAPNFLYQFLSSIRARDGSLFTDSKGRVTSHLMGLFTRTTNLMQKDLKLAYVFDGEPPKLKHEEVEKRRKAKQKAAKLYKEAVKKEDIEDMRKYAARTSRLTHEMIEDAKLLIKALGLPVIQAPSEAEAQAAYITRKAKAFAVVSEDYDSLLFGAKRLVRNLSITRRKKMPGQMVYAKAEPELIELKQTLKELKINQDQLIYLAMLVGTDYNPKGIKGIGPKTALKMVKEFKRPEKLFSEAKWHDFFDISWQEIHKLIKEMPTTDKFKLEWKKPNKKQVTRLLVDEHDFSKERVEKTMDELMKKDQQNLNKFF